MLSADQVIHVKSVNHERLHQISLLLRFEGSGNDELKIKQNMVKL